MKIKLEREKIQHSVIGFVFLVSMLLPIPVEIAGFPLYCLLLFLLALVMLANKMFLSSGSDAEFKPIQCRMDIGMLLMFFYGLLDAIGKFFRNLDDGKIDFAYNAFIFSFVIFYFCMAEEKIYKKSYFDLILYSGLVVMGGMLFYYFLGMESDNVFCTFAENTGAVAAYLLLVSMISVYAYCTCTDRLRSLFYLLIAGVSFLLLFLNKNIVSIWLMCFYFIAIPIVLRPTAALLKRDMQLFFFYLFLLCNMSLLTVYTDVLYKKVTYHLELSVYLELLLAICGLIFLHYWDKIPEGIDLDRLVMRKMRRGFQFVFKVMLILFIGILLGGEKWQSLPEGTLYEVMKEFALPLVYSVQQTESGFYDCFAQRGIVESFFVICMCAFIIGRFRKKYQLDKPITTIFLLISVIFMVQLFFWKPIGNIVTVYYMIMLFGIYYKEDAVRLSSIKIKSAKELKR